MNQEANYPHIRTYRFTNFTLHSFGSSSNKHGQQLNLYIMSETMITQEIVNIDELHCLHYGWE